MQELLQWFWGGRKGFDSDVEGMMDMHGCCGHVKDTETNEKPTTSRA